MVSSPPFRNALVIANPIAGSGRARQSAEELSVALNRSGIETELFLTSGPGDGRRHLSQLASPPELVVSVGGDGTLSEVFNGLQTASEASTIATFPYGTANVLALDLKLPRTVAGMLAMILAGRTSGIDVARVNGELSFLVTGVGLDGAILQKLEADRSGPISRWTYIRYALRALRDWRPARLRVHIDGREVPGRFGMVWAANCIHYGGFRCLAADRGLGDGKFEVYLFEKGNRAALLGYALRCMTLGLPGGTCRRHQARRIEIQSESPVPYQVDGDYRGETPVTIEVTEHPFRLLVP